jgi:phytoene desaturase
MPDVFERFFNDFDFSSADFYSLIKLSPGYRVFFGDNDFIEISDQLEKIYEVFEKEEKGASQKLKEFLLLADKNYQIAIKNLVYKPGLSPIELITKDTILEVKQFVVNINSYVHSNFKSHRLRQILEFPVLFLGAKPEDTPLFYSFMNYADLVLGTWYPEGGMYSVVEGMVTLAQNLGVNFHLNAAVDKILVENNRTVGIQVNNEFVFADIVVSGADYQHTESLIPKKHQNYTQKYWNSRVMAPSALMFYVGFDKEIKNVNHHTLFFDTSFKEHAIEIYDDPKWPKEPLFYASFPTKTDKKIAPKGKEAAIFLIPLAPDLEDTHEIREKYFTIILERLEKLTNQQLKNYIVLKESYCINDFKEDYNSFKGNAYGMANTLFQTAFLRPKLKNKKIDNLFYTGQLTVPGPGVPPALISGKLVSDLITKKYKKYESVI